MDKQNYKECVPVNDSDNCWLQYYSQAYIDGVNTEADDDKHEYLGNKYSRNPDWYYQWNEDEKRYYVVVD